jgi:hypothetical protein
MVIVMNVFEIISANILFLQQRANALSLEESFGKSTVAVTGRHVYVAWHTNETINNNEDVFF